ncbi:MAG: hypothetical protein K1Y02_26030 [Candidatus Hydrogenedentes bacterium]|nr:hypothetical protein [Candidatus Hydrogenedentota bacterium]
MKGCNISRGDPLGELERHLREDLGWKYTGLLLQVRDIRDAVYADHGLPPPSEPVNHEEGPA